MTTILNTILAFITHYPSLAYAAVFLVALSESLALVGLAVPGTVIMFGVGAVVATGSLELLPVLLLAMAGAVAGDGVSYLLGRYYKERLVAIWPFSRYPEMLKKGAAFFHRHGGKSVLFGRFVGPVRPVIPVVAGMLGMRPAHFSVVNVLSAIGWALVYILPGVFFGTSLAVAGAVSTRLVVIFFILVAGIWIFIWFCRKVAALFEHKGPLWFSALKQWTTRETPSHLFVRPLKRFFSFLLFRKQGEELLLGFLVLVLFAAVWGFLGVLQDVLAKDPLVVADQAVYHFFQALRTPWVDSVFVAVTEFGDSFVNVSLACAVLLVLLARRCYRAAGFWTLTVLGGVLGVQLLKWAIHLPRPVSLYHGASAYGFPSGHTTMSVIIYGFLAILIARRLAGAWRWGLFSSVMLVAFVIGISRLYLGAHWLSDVLGGYFIGMSWAALMGIAYLKWPDAKIPRRLLGLVVILVILIAGGWHVIRRHETDLAFYARRYNVQTMQLSDWQSAGWQNFPVWRIDMEGEHEQPLTVQWAGSLNELSRLLMSKGWQQPPSLSPGIFFGMFATSTPIAQLPVLPHLHDGRTESLRLVYTDQDKRLVLRLWLADITIAGGDTPYFIGTVEQQRRFSLAGLITMARDSGAYDRALNLMEKTLGSMFDVRQVRRTEQEMRVEHESYPLYWQGGVLLVWKNGR
jgi:membrane protein DedA with SNARE-associated domain/membrane-associated phospholipid phosphatase